MSSSDRTSGRHPVNVTHLVMGIAFVGIVGAWALAEADVVGGGHVRWLLPMPWVLAGLGGLLALGLAGRRSPAAGPGDLPADGPRDIPAEPDLLSDPLATPEAAPDPETDRHSQTDADTHTDPETREHP